ncbi:MAG: hypothetical protein V2A77_01905 [Pseudomonadota bacterium]
MKALRLRVLALALLTGLITAAPALADSYFLRDANGDTTYYDVQLTGNDDSLMSWAAAASNVLHWGGWGTAGCPTAEAVFQKHVDRWDNNYGRSVDSWKWWLNGDAQHSEGNYWPGTPYLSVYHGSGYGNPQGAMTDIHSFLHSGYGVTVNVMNGWSEHVLTVWGYDTDLAGGFNGLWVTDAEDAVNGLAHYTVQRNGNGEWILDGRYNGYKLWAVEALAQTPVPAALPLLASGLAGLWLRRRVG